MKSRSIALVVLGFVVALLIGATSSHTVGSDEEDAYTGQSGGTTADVVVSLPSTEANDTECEVTVEHDGGPTVVTVKKGEPLHQTFTKITKIKLKKKKPTGNTTITVNVEVDPVNGTTRRTSDWRTTEAEPAIAYSQETPAAIHFGLSKEGSGTATVQALNGTTVVAEYTTDSSDDISASFVGTTIKVLAGSGNGSLRYQTED